MYRCKKFKKNINNLFKELDLTKVKSNSCTDILHINYSWVLHKFFPEMIVQFFFQGSSRVVLNDVLNLILEGKQLL